MVKRGKKPKRQLVKRTRGRGTLTEAQYWGKIRSALRQAFRYWPPITEARKRAKVGKAYRCERCQELVEKVSVDHVEPCGSLRCDEDIAPFIRRLTTENPSAYQALCSECHNAKTQEERKARAEERKALDLPAFLL